MIARSLVVLLILGLSLGASAQWSEAEPEPISWFNVVDPNEDLLLNEGILCPGCETVDEFRNAARTGCFDSYREADVYLFDIYYNTGERADRPGAVPGPNGTYHVAGVNDPCRYNMEIRGNLRGTGKVHVMVCSLTQCRLVTHQFVPTCLSLGLRIGNGLLNVSVVANCLLPSTGLEGLCSTVVNDDLSEDQECITTISDRGTILGELPPIPDYTPGQTPVEFVPWEPHPLGLDHSSPLHAIFNHVLDCFYDAGFGN